jgi:hypothetical protein
MLSLGEMIALQSSLSGSHSYFIFLFFLLFSYLSLNFGSHCVSIIDHFYKIQMVEKVAHSFTNGPGSVCFFKNLTTKA